ncbi:MAG: DUF3039 domain-containing protein [Clostridia bacterium]|nr:DUF3039 domain-containing protein [Clostridia bacterium]
MNMKALHNITYGLYILTAKTEKQSGCVINTLIQLTSSPKQVAIAVNKDNHTAKMIEQTGVFNVSVLTESAPFELIERFGFASGATTDKFANFEHFALAENGVAYIARHTNAYISAKVVQKMDVGTHILFVGEVIAEQVLDAAAPLTYAHYLSHTKPKQSAPKGKWVCKICGYVFEGDVMPEDFVCPICKHPAEDFEKVE